MNCSAKRYESHKNKNLQNNGINLLFEVILVSLNLLVVSSLFYFLKYCQFLSVPTASISYIAR